MPKVIRLDPGGGSVVEQSELSIEQAQSLARSLKAIGEPAGCCWCVGLWDHEDEEEVAVQTPSYTRYHLNTQVPVNQIPTLHFHALPNQMYPEIARTLR